MDTQKQMRRRTTTLNTRASINRTAMTITSKMMKRNQRRYKAVLNTTGDLSSLIRTMLGIATSAKIKLKHSKKLSFTQFPPF
jgi:hypothetical protein